jgi:hypothetical protein
MTIAIEKAKANTMSRDDIVAWVPGVTLPKLIIAINDAMSTRMRTIFALSAIDPLTPRLRPSIESVSHGILGACW